MPDDRVADQLNRAEAGRLPASGAPIEPGFPPPVYPAPWGYPAPYAMPWGYPPPPFWGFPRPY
jgi:hypothetical protein